MARMHSRKKGKSGSVKPIDKKKPSWSRYKSKEIEKLIIKYAKDNMSPSMIGMRLRDAYGVPDVKLIAKKSITQILKDNKLNTTLPEDIMALIKKAIQLKKHKEQNKQDMTAKRGLQLTEAKINRLAKHYKKTNVLSQDWKYDPEKIKLLLD